MVQEVPLHVKDELRAAKGFLSSSGFGRCLPGNLIRPAWGPTISLAGRLGTRVEREQGDGDRARGAEELSPRHSGPASVEVAGFASEADSLGRDRVERERSVFLGAARPEIDGQPVGVGHVSERARRFTAA